MTGGRSRRIIGAMKATIYLDSLSLWCLLAARSLDAVAEGVPDIACDFRIAMIRDGQALGYGGDAAGFYYRRLEALSGVRLNPSWLAGPEVGTYWANAALQAAKLHGVSALGPAIQVMEAAMVHGRETWRREVAAEQCALATGIPAPDLLEAMGSDEVRSVMRATQLEMLGLGMDQRPTIVLENRIPDRAVLMGVWAKEAIAGLVHSMRRDERRFEEFNRTNPFPG